MGFIQKPEYTGIPRREELTTIPAEGADKLRGWSMFEHVGIGIVNPIVFLTPAQMKMYRRLNRVLNPIFMQVAPEFDFSKAPQTPTVKRWKLKFGNFFYYRRTVKMRNDRR